MIKKIWCIIFGHVFREKAFTGRNQDVTGLWGERCSIPLYKWEYTKICPRCGKKTHLTG